jgi:hypothetical protein
MQLRGSNPIAVTYATGAPARDRAAAQRSVRATAHCNSSHSVTQNGAISQPECRSTQREHATPQPVVDPRSREACLRLAATLYTRERAIEHIAPLRVQLRKGVGEDPAASGVIHPACMQLGGGAATDLQRRDEEVVR